MAEAKIVPAVLAADIETYNQVIEQTSRFAKRVSIDFADGEFVAPKTINLVQAHWPDGLEVDFHLMYQKPTTQLETVISLKPHLVVVHAEAEGDIKKLIDELKAVGISAGVALLKDTQPKDVEDLIMSAEHVLIFGGHLGSYGGDFDSSLLSKVQQIKNINPEAEIGWDGGVNPENVKQIASAGVEVINSGGFIQNSEDPKQAYEQLNLSIRE